MKPKSGFTLIELLVVIAIIGILSAVVLTSLNSSRAKANDAQKIANVKQVALAYELTRNQSTGLFPAGDSPTLTPALAGIPLGVSVIDNTSASSTFCVYAVLSDNTHFVASQDGSTTRSAVPVLGDCDAS